MNHLKKVRRTFNKYSESYENWFSTAEGRLIKETEVRAAESLVPEGEGLEVGVGSGIFATELGVKYGIDPAEELLQLASSRGVKAVLGTAEKLPLKGKSLDFLLLMFTLSFLADPLRALCEIHRVLKPEGKLIACFIPKESPWGELYRKKKTENHAFYRHARFHTISKIRELLEKSGFKESVAVSTLFQKPGSVKKTEDPVEGAHKSGGLCCFRAKKD